MRQEVDEIRCETGDVTQHVALDFKRKKTVLCHIQEM